MYSVLCKGTLCKGQAKYFIQAFIDTYYDNVKAGIHEHPKKRLIVFKHLVNYIKKAFKNHNVLRASFQCFQYTAL